MGITTDDIFSIAEELSESSNEAKIRASLGRSYYCAFHLGLNYLDIKDTRTWVGGSGGVHQKLIEEFQYGSNKPVAFMLQNLKAKRHIADYKLDMILKEEDAKASVKLLKSLMEKLK